MKKLLIASLFLAFVSSCDEETPIVTEPGSTEGITLLPKKNALLITGYKFNTTMFANTSVTANSALYRETFEGEFTDRINHISFPDNSSLYYNPLSDSLLTNFGPTPFPYMALNPSLVFPPPLNPITIYPAIETEIAKKPLASVGHVVFKDDTSWVVSCKVKFFDDTLVQPNAIRIETYMLADIEAKEFGAQGFDLRFSPQNDLIYNSDSSSYWDIDVPNIDSTKFHVEVGDPVSHKYIFVKNSNPANPYGTPLSTYWPFAGDFHEGDIIGTRDTEIHHHFAKLEKGEFNFDRKVRFLTVVWALNPITSVYDYVNSYQSNTTYRD